MNVYLFNYTKRPNSTKRPELLQGKEITVQLKDEVSFENPVFKIKSDIIVGTFTPVAFNYAYAPYWQRYYFITDWKFINGCWECSCSVDVLASFRGQIANTTAYITRAASYYDGTIIDSLYPAKSNVQVSKINVASSWYGTSMSGGTFVVGVINNMQSGKVGAISYYALTSSGLGQLVDYLFADNIYYASGIYEISSGLFKSMFDPFQYIVSCMWFPFQLQVFGTNTANIQLGYWTTTVSAIVVTGIAHSTYVTATIPNHPQISRGSYLNYAPYTKLTLYIPPFGSIPINTNFKTLGNYLYSGVYVDHITGQATIRLSICRDSTHLDEYNFMTERSSMIGVPIQLSQVLPDYMGSLQALTSGLSSALTGNVSGAFNGIINAIDSQMPTVSTAGSNGSFTETFMTPGLICEHLLLADENLSEFGRPCCTTKQIGTLSGYVQCGEDDHAFSGTASENEAINRFLKEGFFYE